MRLCKWEDLPAALQTEAVRPYYEQLNRKRGALAAKRLFDIVVSALMLAVLWPVFLILAAAIKLDSPGPVFFRQVRITQYGKTFRIFKFRSMYQGSEKGYMLARKNDARITRVGAFIRKYRLDELCQLIDVFRGTMTFVGTRPEVEKFVAMYTPEMQATLLLPAGVTSLASIFYKDEALLLEGAEDSDAVYRDKILPEKMVYNLRAIKEFSFWKDIKIMFMTVLAVLGVEFDARKTD